ncbi:MAG: c-type cytochrome [Deltaproteobacteria bacterium]|nr:c-type cytochrome [Deltaproteobacteria bacterium]MBW2359310.1 c-type cytochrome [Deltaproteobacteria bacterium]
MRRLLLLLAVLAAGVAMAWWVSRGPAPAEILASIEVPPSPVLSPEAARAAFRTAPGFRVELVAAEPLVVDPVAMDWDDRGRLYVVEMRGFMPDVDGTGEDRPIGRVVVLEDTDGDGRMDRSDVFLDELVLPRAIAVVPEGVLVGAPPDLWLCRDSDGDRACDARIRIADYAAEGPNPEHQENGLLAGLDGWFYNAKSRRRFRFEDGELVVGETQFRGQWGMAQDDAGRLFYNHNSGFLYADAFPAEYALRQSATGLRVKKPGVNVPLSDGELVWGIRVAPGLNRAYVAGTLREDGRQAGPTAISGLAIQRGDQYGPEYVGHAFVPESAGAAVAHFAIEREGTELRAEHRLYPDETWGQREFVASTDERFRPVDADFGPDGAIWVIDMYRGVVQHAHFVSDYLREYVLEHGLEPPGAFGRIWRIVREDRPVPPGPPPLATLEQQLAALDHPNGWLRDRAQRRIVHERAAGALAALRRLDDFAARGRLHALWALDALTAVDVATWRRALGDAEPDVRSAALRVGEALFGRAEIDVLAAIEPLLEDPDAGVRLQALHSLGSLPLASRPLERLARVGRAGDPLQVQAAISGLAGLELVALRAELERLAASDPTDAERGFIEALAAAVHLDAQQRADAVVRVTELLDLVDRLASDAQRVAVLAGIADAQRNPGSRRVELAAAHPLFAAERESGDAVAASIARVRIHITWPGDPRPGGARALSADEQTRRERGAVLYAQSCANCHGAEGRGNAGLAPALVGSPWVRDADAWLVRIALQGLTGPLEMGGEHWNLSMPGHGHDPRFDDDGLAGVITHLRRSWGHAEEPVSPERVAEIRAATAERKLLWTVAELRELPVAHRLDRYVGVYRIPLLAEIVIGRRDAILTLGRGSSGVAELEEIGNGMFAGPDLTIQFEADEGGNVERARLDYQGTSVPLSKAE